MRYSLVAVLVCISILFGAPARGHADFGDVWDAVLENLGRVAGDGMDMDQDQDQGGEQANDADRRLNRHRAGQNAVLLQELLLALFDSEDVCRGGSGEGTGLAPDMCAYLAMSWSFFSFFAYYIAAPCFVVLLLWYFFTYTLRLYRGVDDAPVSFFVKRALALLMATIIIMPARSVLGVNDSRPTAMWAIFKAVQGGMELAGKGIGLALGGLSDAESVQFVQESAGGDPLRYFLLLPITLEDRLERSRRILADMNDTVEHNLRNNPETAALLRDFQSVRLGRMLLGVLMTIGGVALGVSTGGTFLVPALMAAAAGMGTTVMSMGEEQMILSFRDALAEPVFNITLTFAWYMALCVLVVRMMLYAFLGTGMAILVPMGRWGRQKIVSYFSNLLAFILMPVLMAIGWFIGLVVRALYLQTTNIFIYLTNNISGYLGFLAKLLAIMTMPFFFIMPIVLILFRGPAYLSHILGHVFSAGMGTAERMRAPMAR
jgi:hypothetical protein